MLPVVQFSRVGDDHRLAVQFPMLGFERVSPFANAAVDQAAIVGVSFEQGLSHHRGDAELLRERADCLCSLQALVRSMPTLNDPPEAWAHLAEKMGFNSRTGREHPSIGGNCLDLVAEKVCELAGINGHSRPVDWLPLIAWLRDGYDPDERIFPTIRRLAGRRGYAPPRFLSYFDQAIRSADAA